jgi:ABC-type dipeptide/oligopeptide/nickel transport system permease component
VRALRRVVDAVSSAPVLVWCTLIYLVMARVIGKIPGSDDLPVVTLVLSALALVMGDRLLADMVQRVEIATRETLNEPYMRTVRAGGFGVRRHLMQSLVAPVATAVQSRAMFLISGAIIVELLFDLPGLGSQITQSLQSGDQQPMVTLAASMALVLFGLIFRAVQRVATRLADRRPAK